LEQFEKWAPPGRSTCGRRHPTHPAGGVSKKSEQTPGRGLFAKENFSYLRRDPWYGIPPVQQAGGFPISIPPSQRAGGSLEGHPALPTGGRFPRGTSGPPNGRDVPHYLSPPSTPNFHNIQQNSKEGKGGEEERRGEETAKPCPHVGLEVYSRYSCMIINYFYEYLLG
jgi:hypothetical protein